MVDNRTMAILMELFATRKESLYELSIQTGIEKEQLYSNLELVNQLLQEHSFRRYNTKIASLLFLRSFTIKKKVYFRSFAIARSIFRKKKDSFLSIFIPLSEKNLYQTFTTKNY